MAHGVVWVAGSVGCVNRGDQEHLLTHFKSMTSQQAPQTARVGKCGDIKITHFHCPRKTNICGGFEAM